MKRKFNLWKIWVTHMKTDSYAGYWIKITQNFTGQRFRSLWAMLVTNFQFGTCNSLPCPTLNIHIIFGFRIRLNEITASMSTRRFCRGENGVHPSLPVVASLRLPRRVRFFSFQICSMDINNNWKFIPFLSIIKNNRIQFAQMVLVSGIASVNYYSEINNISTYYSAIIDHR